MHKWYITRPDLFGVVTGIYDDFKTKSPNSTLETAAGTPPVAVFHFREPFLQLQWLSIQSDYHNVIRQSRLFS